MFSRRQFLTSSASSVALTGMGLVTPGIARAATLPAWVSNLPLWQWYAIPNTALSSIEPSPRPAGNTGPSAKLVAWCGATLKRAGSVYMLGAAGGHTDYVGNEVNALQLNADSPRWQQLRAPTDAVNVITNSTQFYLDLRPAATHTYYATQFVNSLNKMIVMPSTGPFGLGTSPPSGWPYMNGNLVYSFNMASGDWDRPDLSSYFKPYSGGGDFIAALCVKHPVTDDIYYSRSGGAGWYRFSAAANTWTKLSGETRNPWYAGSAIDSVRNRILIVGGYDNNAPEVRDLNGTRQSVSFGGLGASALSTGSYPGVIYDEANDKFLVFFNSGGVIAVRRVDPATWQVDAPSIGGSVPASRSNGILNSVQYAPELGGFVIANRYDGNVYFVRTSAAGQASPAPDTTPPAVPAGLIVS